MGECVGAIPTEYSLCLVFYYLLRLKEVSSLVYSMLMTLTLSVRKVKGDHMNFSTELYSFINLLFEAILRLGISSQASAALT